MNSRPLRSITAVCPLTFVSASRAPPDEICTIPPDVPKVNPEAGVGIEPIRTAVGVLGTMGTGVPTAYPVAVGSIDVAGGGARVDRIVGKGTSVGSAVERGIKVRVGTSVGIAASVGAVVKAGWGAGLGLN